MMLFDETTRFEKDPRFPSGAWTGYWVHEGTLGFMQLNLGFAGSRVKGEGSDHIGEFIVCGLYWVEDGKVSLYKRYHDKYTVRYHGKSVRDELKGRWEIYDSPARGDWHIWPEEDEFEITHLEIEDENGPIVIYDEDEDEEPEEDDS